MNAAEIFARHALATRFDTIPPAAVAAAKTFILDTIGVGVAGARAAYADEILRAARAWGVAGVAGAAHVLGRKQRLPAPAAAFVNGFQIHCQEFDCVHEAAVVHPMATIFAALLAECERQPAIDGRSLIAAVVVAVDVAASLGVAAKAPIRFFRPANAGLFGATLGVARLRQFDLDAAQNALGYALAHCSGTMQAHVEGKPALPVQIGNAARAAHLACDLAEAGLPGPLDSITGPFGYMPLFEETFDLAPVLAALGRTWRIAEVSHKPYPTGRAAQGGIRAIGELRARGVRADNLASLTLAAPPLIKRLVGRPFMTGMSVNYARLCFQYSGSVALLRGAVGLADFSDAALADAEVAAFAPKIAVVDDGSVDPAAFTPQIATARLVDGPVVEIVVNELYGSPAAPLDRAAQLEKFHACLRFGLGDNAQERAEELIDRIDRLEQADNVSEIAALAAGL